MIDCSKTENFIREKERICQYYTDMGCTFCVLDRNIEGLSCSDFIVQQPKKAIEIVQKWSNEQPQRTFLTDFIEKHPKAPLDSGYPRVCPYFLGYMTDHQSDDCPYSEQDCRKCWDTPINENLNNKE